MPGPSLFIRQQVPIATVDYDGLMSKEQAAVIASITGGPFLPLAGGTMDSGADIISAGGVANIDFSASSGTMKTPSGLNTFLSAAEMDLFTPGRVALRTIAVDSNISALQLEARGASSSTDPAIRIFKNRSNADPIDEIRFSIGNSLNAAQFFYFRGSGVAADTSMTVLPGTANVWALGSVAQYFSRIHAALHMTVLGGNLSSTGSNVTIAPTTSLHHVTGVGSIQTITIPFTGFVGSITLIPDGAFTTVTGGNIARATTAVLSQALIMTYDGTSWYPSYV